VAGKRLQKRKKKQGKALLISRLIRLGMLAVLLACLALTALGIRACANYFSKLPAPAQSMAQEDMDISRPLEEPSVPAVQPIRGIVTVDPGHGGIDPGCGTEGGLEKDIVLPIAMHLRQLLEQAGVTVVMTRTTDDTLSLDDRAILANNAGSDLFVSVHCNSYEGQARGMDVYYHKSESAKLLAQSILDEAAVLGLTTRQIQKNNYQVLWDTDMPAVLVETGFLTDPTDLAQLLDPAHQQTVARAIANAVLAWLDTESA
jgi:N-acetylmuramoyl-L-alanine amidase